MGETWNKNKDTAEYINTAIKLLEFILKGREQYKQKHQEEEKMNIQAKIWKKEIKKKSERER